MYTSEAPSASVLEIKHNSRINPNREGDNGKLIGKTPSMRTERTDPEEKCK